MANSKKHQEHNVDMEELGKILNRIPGLPAPEANPEVLKYAPPTIRNLVPPIEPAIEHVEKFIDLPTSELDEIISAAEDEIKSLKEEAQHIRDVYSKYSKKLRDDLTRLRDGVKLSMQTLETLRTQCVVLDQELVQIKKDIKDEKRDDTKPGGEAA